MRDADCVEFLQWALPELNMSWPGFRKVRRQVCKRLSRRLRELELETLDEYRNRLAVDRDEWQVLDAACRITISRFYRDKDVFEVLGREVLPELASEAQKEDRRVRIWCAGCASGEEVYSLAILWDEAVRPACPRVEHEITGTDADPVMIARAERACYSRGTLKDMPPEWLDRAFEKSDGKFRVAARYRRDVSIFSQDIREEQPEGPFDLILCRNLVFTYFAQSLQQSVLNQIKVRLRPGGYLVIGAHETLPPEPCEFEVIAGCGEILRRSGMTAVTEDG